MSAADRQGQRMKTVTHTIGPDWHPPLEIMGGSVHSYERGKDPMAREFMPEEFLYHFPDKPADTGWLALDYWGNVIGFAKDGDKFTHYEGNPID